MISLSNICGAQTPPIQPNVTETALPPAVELPAPTNIPADVPNKPLTADEAADIALRHQPDVITAAANVSAEQGKKQQAKSGLLPTLDAGASYTNTAISPSTTGTSVGTATSPGYQMTANVNQLLYDFNHTREVVRQASSLVKSAGHNLTQVESNTILQVKQAFYTFSQNQRLVEVNEVNVRDQQSHLADARARLDSGLGTPADVVRAETAVASAIYSLSEARNNASIAGVNLATVMGIDPRTPILAAESDEPPINEKNVNTLVNMALSHRPELLGAQSDVDAAKHGLNAAKTGNAPALAANAGWLQKGSDFPPSNNSLTYGFSIQWSPFDGGLTKGQIKEAEANLQESSAALSSTRLSVISDVSQAYLNLNTAEQSVLTAESELANAQESLRLIQGRYEAGLGTFLDVLDAQSAFLTAQTNLVNAKSAVDKARAAMVHAVGCPIKQRQSK